MRTAGSCRRRWARRRRRRRRSGGTVRRKCRPPVRRPRVILVPGGFPGPGCSDGAQSAASAARRLAAAPVGRGPSRPPAAAPKSRTFRCREQAAAAAGRGAQGARAGGEGAQEATGRAEAGRLRRARECKVRRGRGTARRGAATRPGPPAPPADGHTAHTPRYRRGEGARSCALAAGSSVERGRRRRWLPRRTRCPGMAVRGP
jgi:hypothetical protein